MSYTYIVYVCYFSVASRVCDINGAWNGDCGDDVESVVMMVLANRITTD